jgi:hypothetical protein
MEIHFNRILIKRKSFLMTTKGQGVKRELETAWTIEFIK